jgi:isopentenyldiphosphate isomerase
VSDWQPLGKLRQAVRDAQYGLDDLAFEHALRLFSECSTHPEEVQRLKHLSPEYGRPEFLVCVEEDGTPVQVSPGVLDRSAATASAWPDFRLWFQRAFEGEGCETLLVARWLCHLAGFRHRAVQLFIDHPAVAGYTLIQVRGVGRFVYPGCFDVPVAGHVVGVQREEEALFREAKEELGLDRVDLADIRSLGGHACYELGKYLDIQDAEHLSVYAGRLRSDSWDRIRFTDREVAALAVFSLAEIQGMMAAFPDRVASGLTHSLPLYLAGKLAP